MDPKDMQRWRYILYLCPLYKYFIFFDQYGIPSIQLCSKAASALQQSESNLPLPVGVLWCCQVVTSFALPEPEIELSTRTIRGKGASEGDLHGPFNLGTRGNS